MTVKYEPPRGKPLGTNLTFRIGTKIAIPLFRAIIKKSWKGAENIPASGPAIVISNHLSYIDVLLFTDFLYGNGRAPRFLGKSGIFKVPLLGRILLAAGQIPVDRQSPDASKALDHAVAVIEGGHLLGVYPEGTLTRDEQGWPMVAKTGIARLALRTKAPVIPVAQWGSQIVIKNFLSGMAWRMIRPRLQKLRHMQWPNSPNYWKRSEERRDRCLFWIFAIRIYLAPETSRKSDEFGNCSWNWCMGYDSCSSFKRCRK